MEVVKFKINRGQDPTFTIVCIPNDELNYQTFIANILNKFNLSLYCNYLFSITYIDGKNNKIEIRDPTSFELFMKQTRYVINITKRTDKATNIKHLNHLGKRGRIIQAVRSLRGLVMARRKEKSKEFESKIKEQRENKTILLPKMSPNEQYQNTLLYAVDCYQKLNQQMGSVVKEINNPSIINTQKTPIPKQNNKDEVIFMSQIQPNQNQDIYKHEIQCEGCKRQIIGLRLKCNKCEFNICKECQVKKNYNHIHKYFILIYNSEQYNKESRAFMNISEIKKKEDFEKTNILEINAVTDAFEMLLCEPQFYVEIDSQESKKGRVTIGYQTTLKPIKCELISEIEGITVTTSKIYNAHTVKFTYIDANPQIYEIEGAFFQEKDNLRIKRFTIIVNVK